MKYYHMQMHPNNPRDYTAKKILSLVDKGYIGIDVNTRQVVNKPFTEWTEKELSDYNEEYPTWKKQITSFLNLKINDIVLVRHGEKFIALVKITGVYKFSKIEGLWFSHMYPIEILSTYKDFKEEFKIPKAQGTFEISKSGGTFKIIEEIYKKTTKGEEMQEKINLLKHRRQIILQGPPGTGKTRLAKQMARYIIKGETEPNIDDIKNQVKLIQFHPSYSYEDFVRGIVAKSNGTTIEYKTENKVLAQMAKEASENEDKPYILIIDEINRANLSSVLGELIYALEYRNEAVESMYALDDSREIILPSNLYIIGTMNTADRSVGHIDYAIRRRFAFESVLPNKDIIDLDEGKKLFEAVENIFENKSPEFDKDDIMLGHSYFIAKDKDELEEKLKYQIKPLLLEYIKDGILNENAKEKVKELKI